MPIIALANTSGGSGKTTTSLLLATEFEAMGHKVSILDADPQAWATVFGRSKNKSPNIDVIEKVAEEDVGRMAKREAAKGRIVIIDLEGTANQGFNEAARHADLVLMPVEECMKTAHGAVKTARNIRRLGQSEGLKVDHRVIFTKLNPMCATVEYREARAQIEKADIPFLSAGLPLRREYKGVQRFGVRVGRLPAKRYTKKANAVRSLAPVVAEVAGILKIAPVCNKQEGEAA